MNTASIIQLVRAEANDSQSKYWTDAHIVALTNTWARALFRQRVDADPSYGAQPFTILGTDTTRVVQRHKTIWSYYLPAWVFRLKSVEELASSTEERGLYLPPKRRARAGVGWTLQGNRRLDVTGWETPKDIRVWCSKTPALAWPGAVKKASASATHIYLDPAPTGGYAVETDPDSIIGASVEVTGVASNTRDPRGIHEVVSATREWDAGLASWLLKCEVMPHFGETLALNDTYDMHPEVGEEHTPYLVYLVVRSLLQEHNNEDRLVQILPLLREQRREFIDGIQPRDDEQPQFVSDPYEHGIGQYPEDRDPYYYGGM